MTSNACVLISNFKLPMKFVLVNILANGATDVSRSLTQSNKNSEVSESILRGERTSFLRRCLGLGMLDSSNICLVSMKISAKITILVLILILALLLQ